jgi:hypothetical protein
MAVRGVLEAILAGSAIGQVESPRRRRLIRRAPLGWERWVREPKSTVLLILAAVILLGGGRKLLQAWRARGAVGRLEDPDVSTEAIAAAAGHGRAALMELFRLLNSAETEALQDAAGHALSVLWARDELIAEEEKALVRRGYQVQWKARRRYPRALRAAIPIGVSFGVPFLRDSGEGVHPTNLEWSYRISGAGRASLEVFSPWVAGLGDAGFTLIPTDFESNGPHKLAFQARVRTVGLTESWEIELPHMPFSFELDPLLAVDALLALPDDTRAGAFARSVRLVADGEGGLKDEPSYLPLNEGMALRPRPAIEVTTPLPIDLAHSVEIELAGVSGWFAAGAVVMTGQGDEGAPSTRRCTLGPIALIPAGAVDRPGVRAMRARLIADPDRGWSDPDIRSIWPGTIETDWVDVEVVRI